MTSVELNERIARANAMCDKLNNERQLNLGKKETLKAQLDSAIKEYATQYGVTLTKDTLQLELERVQSEKETELNKIESIITLINEGNYVEARRLAGEDIAEVDNTLQLDVPVVEDTQKQKKGKSSKNTTNVTNTETIATPTVTNTPTTASVPVPPTVPVMPMQTNTEDVVAPSVSVNPMVSSVPVPPSVPVAPSVPVPPSVPVTPSVPVAPTAPVMPMGIVSQVDTPTIPIVPTTPSVPVAPDVLGGALAGFQPAPTMMGEIPVAPPTTFQSILGGTDFEG